MHRELSQHLRMRCGHVRQHDEVYLAWLRQLPCVVCGSQTGVEAHHEPPKGMGGGHASDYDAVPLCGYHHRLRHNQQAVPDGETWSGAELAAWVKCECENARLGLLQAYFGGDAVPRRARR